MEVEYMIYKRKNHCSAVALTKQLLYESWNWILLLITGLSKDSDLGFWIEGFYFKKH